MKLLNWVRFTWNLTRLPESALDLPEHYRIAPAVKEDETEVRKVFSSSFLLDPAWNPTIKDVMQSVQMRLDDVFTSAQGTCLVLRHGARIIGATVLSLDFDAEDHLAPGPSILVEYRNRGFGTLLLENSLRMLRDTGLIHATGIAPDSAPVTRFLYPKFDAVISPAEFSPLVAV